MHRFTAQLALIAYLIGGWLLPAAHHHGHDQAAGGGNCGCHSESWCDSASWGHSGLVCVAEAGSAEPAHDHEHDHDVCCAQRSSLAPLTSLSSLTSLTSLPAALDAGDLSAGDSRPSSDCVGLCALCCAASLLGRISPAMAIDVIPVEQHGKLIHEGLAGPLPPLLSGLSSRGPPAV